MLRRQPQRRRGPMHIEPQGERGVRGGYAGAVPATTRAESPALVAHGIVGGLLAGIAVGLIAMVVAVLMGRGVFLPVRLTSAVVFGPSAMAGVAPVLVGIAIHLSAAIVLGVVFALIVGGFRPSLLWWGLAYGAALWFVAEFILLPMVNPMLHQGIPALLLLVYSSTFGAVLGSYLAQGRSE